MAYNTEITKTEIPEFVELYDIEFPDLTLYLTSHENDVDYYLPGTSVPLRTYQRAVIQRSEIRKTLDIMDSELTVSIAVHDRATRLVATYTLPRASIKITRYFPSTRDSKVIWVGEVDAISARTNIVTLRCIPISTNLKNKIPNLAYQSVCNHQLFDKGCGLDASSYRLITTVSVDGSKLISDDFAAKPNGYYTLGYVSFAHETRLITNHEGNTIWLQLPFDTSPDGKEVHVYPGCDKRPETCKNKFNNLNHFLGFPYIPFKNPVVWGV